VSNNPNLTEFKQLAEDVGRSESKFFSEARNGEMAAFEKLVERHRDDVYAFGLVITGSETEAGDIAQESFLSAYLHLQQFENEAQFGTWVHRISAMNAELRLRFCNDRPAGAQFMSPELGERGARARHAADRLWGTRGTESSARLCRAIQEAAERLPYRHRAVLFYKDVLGLTYECVSEITGQPVEDIKPRLHQARLKLCEVIDGLYNEIEPPRRKDAAGH